jgi:Surface antigen
MKRMMTLWLAVLLTCVVTACQTKQDTGTLAGVAAGAAVGSAVGDSTTATLLGAIGGALLGREIGRRMDERDRREVASTLEDQPTGETKSWTNPDTGQTYAVTPTDTFERDGQPCRKFRMDVEGEQEEVVGTACRNSEGQWQIVG